MLHRVHQHAVHRTSRAFCGPRPVHRALLPNVAAVKTETAAPAIREAEEEEEYTGPDVDVQASDVAALLNTLTSETQIAQLQLKMGSFELTVKRNVADDTSAAAAAPAAAAPAASARLVLPASVSMAAEPHLSPALALAPLPYISMDEPGALESVDEALVPVTASKVGVFRRGKYAAGKKVGKGNVANEGDQVKKGQTLGYIEQLGTFVEIKAPQAGEIAAYKAAEGDPVEYGQSVVLLAPFFGVEEAGVTQHRL